LPEPHHAMDLVDRDRPMLLDVSRLVWRAWRGGLPTGIDRVCLAYVERFGPRSFALLQRGRVRLVLPLRASDRVFSVLLKGTSVSRLSLAWTLAFAIATGKRRPLLRGMTYLNVGHTGLHERSLPAWIRANALRAVYLIHDLIPITHPQFCRLGEADKHRQRIRNALKSASGIICNSQATVEELMTFAEEEHLETPPIVASWISGQIAKRPTAGAKPSRPYFIALGTIEGRKNHQLLLDVWSNLIEGCSQEAVPGLMIVGQRGWKAERVFELLDEPGRLGRHVRELGSCDDEELTKLLSGATALLMPSFAEGFGLPIIEALQLGTPIIASDLPVFREIAGEIPQYVDPADVGAWTEAIVEFSKDDREGAKQRLLMAAYRPPTWDMHFAVVEPWLDGLAPRSELTDA
jgi:glycosyltransferase involved in cell wall biosynthesis